LDWVYQLKDVFVYKLKMELFSGDRVAPEKPEILAGLPLNLTLINVKWT
jgi:hypothetical protein